MNFWTFWKTETVVKELTAIRKLLEAIHWATIARPRFGRVVVDDYLRTDGNMASNVTLGLLPPTPTTAEQLLTLAADGLVGTFRLTADVTEVKFSVNPGAEIHATLQYADAKGNLSTPAETTFLAEDTVPPDAPGGFGTISVNDTPEPDPDYPTLDQIP